ncbi:cannabinoid receptor 2 [Lingula anatina]|uniref:Cannabinoid receptor 2 n=1 Tax=Lingula anatina TaxID=7574 RepID=A0A1S3I4X3_LINAN|nr:cannabinoid receptor 2 [Lingula anatina]XP_013393272.1 cannabinoid receptor 2 [Lingula anatina]XP_013393273.1 cannabinoid receptor 2 [Lingula anatina]XP_013393275.1 cannabinoid receptor 2 [Lingula anatina]|eukprot:XP_013393271.1 cannabinoid receptor 2 [Lingula anatina]
MTNYSLMDHNATEYPIVGTGLGFSPGILFHLFHLDGDRIEFRVTYTVAFVLEVIGVVMNIVSLSALYNISRPVRPLQVLIIHLAAADLLFLVSGMVSTCLVLAEIYTPGMLGQQSPVWCVGEILIDVHINCFPVPFIITTYIVLNQLLALTFPLRYKAFVSKRRINVILGISYVVVVVLFLTFHMVSLTQGDSCLSHFSKTYINATSWYLGILCSVLILVNLLLYVGLFIKAKDIIRSHKGSFQLQEAQKATANCATIDSRKDRKLLITIFLLSVTIVVLWTPAIVTFYLKTLIASRDFEERIDLAVVQAITGVVAILNSLVDPLVYGIRLPEVRAGYSRLMGNFRNCCRGPASQGGISREATKSTSC